MSGFFDVLNRRANPGSNRGYDLDDDDGHWSDQEPASRFVSSGAVAGASHSQSPGTFANGYHADISGSLTTTTSAMEREGKEAWRCELATDFRHGLRFDDNGLFDDYQKDNDSDSRRSDGRRTQQSLLDECGEELWAEETRCDFNRFGYVFINGLVLEDRCATRANSEDVFASPQLRRLDERKVPEVLTRDVRALKAGGRDTPPQSVSKDRFSAFDDWGKKKKREKYMPVQKTDCELFDVQTQIKCGEHFDALCGDQADSRSNFYEVAISYGNDILDDESFHMTSFDDCNFESAMRKNIKLLHLERPTRVQQCVMPLILREKRGDILVSAPTGSGKTAAFMLPIVHRIARTKLRRSTDKPPVATQHVGTPYALILAPSRELCQQLYEDAERFSFATGVSACVSYGEMPMQENLRAIRNGCDIFISTVTRIQHFVRDGHISFRNVKFWVMDEADRILNPDDYNYQSLYELKTTSDINPRHRTFLFSATQTVATLNTLECFVDSSSTFIVNVGRINCVVNTVAQNFEEVSKYDKRDRLMQLLLCRSKKHEAPDGEVTYSVGRTIVFVARKNMSERLAHDLARNGFSVINVNSDRTQRQRVDAMEKFSKGIYDILVATDLVSRGMNFPEVEHVINYDLPTAEPTSYVHRLGRTGRAGNVGRATSFFDREVDSRLLEYYMTNVFNKHQPAPAFMAKIYEAQLRMQAQYFRPINLSAG